MILFYCQEPCIQWQWCKPYWVCWKVLYIRCFVLYKCSHLLHITWCTTSNVKSKCDIHHCSVMCTLWCTTMYWISYIKCTSHKLAMECAPYSERSTLNSVHHIKCGAIYTFLIHGIILSCLPCDEIRKCNVHHIKCHVLMYMYHNMMYHTL